MVTTRNVSSPPMKINIEKIAEFTGHQGSVYSLIDGFENDSFFSAGSEGMVVNWSLNKPDEGEMIAKVEGQIFSLCLMEETKELLIGTMKGGWHVNDLATKKEKHFFTNHTDSVFDLKFWSEEKLILSASKDGFLHAWNEKFELVKSLYLTPDGLRCLEVNGNNFFVGGSDNAIYCFENFEIRQKISDAANSIFSSAISGNYLLAGSRDAHIYIYGNENGKWKLIHKIPAHNFTINDIKFHESKEIFATASRDKTIKLWNAENFELMKVIDTKFKTHSHSVNKLLWKGNHLLSCGDDKKIIQWHIDL